MSRELWAITRCEHGWSRRHIDYSDRTQPWCEQGSIDPLDFDAIWDRYRSAKRLWAELSKEQLREVVLGGTDNE